MTERPTLTNKDQTLNTPCFDDDRTISTARQVVPLQLVGTNVKHKRTCFLVGSFTLALLMGSVSGLVSAYFEQSEMSIPPVVERYSLTSDVSLEDVLSTASKDNFSTIVSQTETQHPQQVTAHRILTMGKPRLIRVSANHSITMSPLSEDEELRKIREEVLLHKSKKRIRPTGEQ